MYQYRNSSSVRIESTGAQPIHPRCDYRQQVYTILILGQIYDMPVPTVDQYCQHLLVCIMVIHMDIFVIGFSILLSKIVRLIDFLIFLLKTSSALNWISTFLLLMRNSLMRTSLLSLIFWDATQHWIQCIVLKCIFLVNIVSGKSIKAGY